MKSRLTQAAEKRTKKQLYLSIAGIIIVLFLLIKFGIPALVNFSLFVTNLKAGSSPTSNTNQNAPILPPTLSSTFSATNSATINLSGTAAPKQTIQIFVNDDLVDTTQTKEDGSFTFSQISLTQQQNTIKARSQQGNKQSDFSDPITISYVQKAPTLTLDSPSDGQSFGKDQQVITVRGTVDPPDIRVTVNDFWAIVDSKGNYSYSLKLQNGDNQIKVVATDNAGNTTQKQIKVTSSQ